MLIQVQFSHALSQVLQARVCRFLHIVFCESSYTWLRATHQAFDAINPAAIPLPFNSDIAQVEVAADPHLLRLGGLGL